MNLLDLQRRMSADVRRPLTRTSACRRLLKTGSQRRRWLPATSSPSATLTSFERLEIYNRQYWFRVHRCAFGGLSRAQRHRRSGPIRRADSCLPERESLDILYSAEPGKKPARLARPSSGVHGKAPRTRHRCGPRGVGLCRGFRRGQSASADGIRRAAGFAGHRCWCSSLTSGCCICAIPSTNSSSPSTAASPMPRSSAARRRCANGLCASDFRRCGAPISISPSIVTTTRCITAVSQPCSSGCFPLFATAIQWNRPSGPRSPAAGLRPKNKLPRFRRSSRTHPGWAGSPHRKVSVNSGGYTELHHGEECEFPG